MIYYDVADYYDERKVVEEYEAGEPEKTLCDCGNEAEDGNVYCAVCKRTIAEVMTGAKEDLMNLGFSENAAEEAMVQWLSYPEDF